jgi:hypothetical protein
VTQGREVTRLFTSLHDDSIEERSGHYPILRVAGIAGLDCLRGADRDRWGAPRASRRLPRAFCRATAHLP